MKVGAKGSVVHFYMIPRIMLFDWCSISFFMGTSSSRTEELLGKIVG